MSLIRVHQFADRAGLATLMAVCFAGIITVLLAHHPQYDDWDAFAYVAVALRDAGTPLDQVHRETFQVMRAFLPPAYWDLLTGHGDVDPEFRQALTANASAFMAQLPFYSVKPIYPMLMAILYETGAGMTASAMAITSAAYFGFGLVVYFWFRCWMQPFIAFAAMALTILNPYLVSVGRAMIPDMLSVLTIFTAVFVVLEHRRFAAVSVALLLFALLIRPENIIYAGVFIIYMGYRRDIRLPWIATLLAGLAAVYLIVARTSGYYGWQTLFEFTFINKSSTFVEVHHEIAFYANVYLSRIDRILFGRFGELPVFALVAFGALCLKLGRPDYQSDRYLHLVLICIVLAPARMVILPRESVRGLLPVYMLVTVALIQACCEMVQVTAQRAASLRN
jgi:hypothetical protein